MPYEVFKRGPRKDQPKTLTDRIVRFLEEERGMVEMSSGDRYRKFVNKFGERYWVGSSGAVRKGRIPSSSISITEATRHSMEVWEESAYPSPAKLAEEYD